MSLPAPDHRPDWISVKQWATLPAMLRAALIGSTVIDGTLQAVSPHLAQLIATRYARAVAELGVVASAEYHTNAMSTFAAQDHDPVLRRSGKRT